MSTREAISMSDFGRGGGKGAKAAISLAAPASPCWASAVSERSAIVVPVWPCEVERTATIVPVSGAVPVVVSPRNALRKLGRPDAGAFAAATSVGAAGSVARPAWTLRERNVVAGAGACAVAEVSACDMMKA